jgi:predicted metal-dependent phosphoesterase TrpH
MTPLNIAAAASLKGLNAIAVSDHNSVKNVEAAMECGKDFNLIVIPAMEVQTSEDIHLLALFERYEDLLAFDQSLIKTKIKNKEEVFGNQLIIDQDNKIAGIEEYLLIAGVKQNVYETAELAKRYGGIAIAAHIDRVYNGIVAILGSVPKDLDIAAVEIYDENNKELRDYYSNYLQLFNSDAHRLQDINSAKHYLEIEEMSARAVLKAIKEGKN